MDYTATLLWFMGFGALACFISLCTIGYRRNINQALWNNNVRLKYGEAVAYDGEPDDADIH